MEIRQIQQEHYVTLSPVGDLDAHSSVHLDEKIQKLVEAGKVMIHVDFSEVTYISSAGLGVFISYLDEIASQGGQLVLSQLSDNIYDVFSILGLNKLDHLIILSPEEKEVATYFAQK